ncbi:MAG: hypothetical protein WCH99_19165 [Verrucomicrobiota bacterium]
MPRPSKTTLTKVSTGAGRRWMVRYRDPIKNKITRRFFEEKPEASEFLEKVRFQNRDAESAWALLNSDEKSNLVAVWREARRRNVDLMAAVIAAEGLPDKAVKLSKVISELIVAKRNAGRNKDYLWGLENYLNRFAKGREKKPILAVDSKMVATFLETLPEDSRTTARSRISTLFNFAVRHGYIPANPCARLERAKVVQKLPAVMSPEEAAQALEYLIKPPVHINMPDRFKRADKDAHEALAWFILTAFAGLRPEEAMQIKADELKVNLEAKPRPFVEVKPEATKTGNWRIVYPRQEVVRALQWALDHGSWLPFPQWNKARLQRRLSAHLGWNKWKQDVTRRSAASYWLAMTNDLKLMVEMLGNSESIFKRHYKKPVPREQAVKYFAALDRFK